MASSLAWNAIDGGSISTLDTIFPIFPASTTLLTSKALRCFPFHHTHNTDCHDKDPAQAMRCMVVEPTMCVYVRYVIVSIKTTYNSRGTDAVRLHWSFRQGATYTGRSE